jgi:hypothetical protein
MVASHLSIIYLLVCLQVKKIDINRIKSDAVVAKQQGTTTIELR